MMIVISVFVIVFTGKYGYKILRNFSEATTVYMLDEMNIHRFRAVTCLTATIMMFLKTDV